MPISLGTTTVTALFLGTTSISSAYLGNTQVFGGSFSPLSLFSGGAQGIWYDPSDLSTMFSDRAGTTPVTTPGTVVGLRLDKSKGLTLGAELVTNGDFSSATGWTVGAGWTISGGVATRVADTVASGVSRSISPTAGVSYQVTYTITSYTSGNFLVRFTGGTTVNGTTRVGTGTFTEIIVAATGNNTVDCRMASGSGALVIDNISVRELPGNHAVAPTDAARPTYGVEPKGGRRNLLLATDTLATQSITVTAVAHTLAFTGTGTVTLSGASTAGPLVGTGAGNRVSLTFTPTAASLTLTVSGSVTLGQLELGSSATAYQKVVTAYDVTESGVATCHYVQFDGSDDSMSTASIDFTGTNKMSVFAGVRKLSDSGSRVLAELSSVSDTSNGSFGIFAPTSLNSSFDVYVFALRGTSQTAVQISNFPSPTSDVLSVLYDISAATLATETVVRADGTIPSRITSGTTAGTGNFGNYPLFIGRRNNATLPFSGKDYGLIVVGKAASAGETTDTETWLAARTSGVSI